MAKDGTRRGGARTNPGPKTIPHPEHNEINIDDKSINNYTKPPKYFTAKQENGIKLDAKKIFLETQVWLEGFNVLDKVPTQLIEQYSMTYARWRQAEQMISKKGTIAPHPTTRAPIQSPLVVVSNTYFKDCQTAWYAIWAIAKENISITGGNIDDMENFFMGK